MPTLAFAEMRPARHSQLSRNPLRAGYAFRGFTGSLLLQPVRLLAPLHESDRISPASEGFYIQASDGSVTLPAAGYVLFFIHLESRGVNVVGITAHPGEPWMEQIARNVTMDGWGILCGCRYLLHDRGGTTGRDRRDHRPSDRAVDEANGLERHHGGMRRPWRQSCMIVTRSTRPPSWQSLNRAA